MAPRDKPPSSRFKQRFIWLWHPHFWLTALLVALLIFLIARFAV